ncbi:carotenoid oxygenase family protein [Kitasatospora sp. NPDC001175]|uniref:carotenoid oxygenase family protein n=1 Tax=Kitasatospora sp. NPDC001175 TaxID=3157103 RepID=UPI003CFD9D24
MAAVPRVLLGTRHIHQVGDARLPSEAVFVPAAGASREDDGYLLTVTSDLKQDSSQLLVLDASDLPDRRRPTAPPCHRRHPRLLDPRHRPRPELNGPATFVLKESVF